MALTFDPAELAIPSGHHIGGKFVHLGKADIDVLRPSDHQIFGAIADGGEEAVGLAVDAARKALKESRWARLAPRERARVLRRWADLINEQNEYLARLEAAGSSRLISLTAVGDVVRTADVIRFFAEYCDKLEGEVTATEEGTLSLVNGSVHVRIRRATPIISVYAIGDHKDLTTGRSLRPPFDQVTHGKVGTRGRTRIPKRQP